MGDHGYLKANDLGIAEYKYADTSIKSSWSCNNGACYFTDRQDRFSAIAMRYW